MIETEEQSKCPFCHGKACLNDATNSNFQINIDTSFGNGVEKVAFFLEDQGKILNSRLDLEINYCSMCGRKLSNEW